MISEILAGLNILDRIGKLWSWFRTRKSPPVESVATRFVRLLESHGVHRNQIPRFIGHGLMLKDVQDDTQLLAKLDESILQTVCEKFAIRREWLDGAESQIYPRHDFYKAPKEFVNFIQKLMTNNSDADLQGVLIAPKEHERTYALLILQETIGSVGDRPIYRFHLCHNWAFNYWKARGYLTACVAIAWKHQVYVYGFDMPQKQIDRLSTGESLLNWREEGIWKLGHIDWHPEDMALKPDAYLNGIHPELNNFGTKSALELWLDLDHEGFMDAGFNLEVRHLFQEELGKYSTAGNH